MSGFVTFSRLRFAVALTVAVLCLDGCVDLTRPATLIVANDGGSGGRQPLRDAGSGEWEGGAQGGAPGAADADVVEPPDTQAEIDADPVIDARPAEDAPPAGPIDAPVVIDVPPDQPRPPDVLITPDVPVTPDAPALAGPGAACSTPSTCASGICVEGVCCKTACGGPCFTCAAAATAGTCTAKATGTSCAAASCNAGGALAESRCDSAGQCKAPTPLSCAPYACSGASCGSACLTATDCASPYTCSNGACVSAGLILRYPLDEVAGTSAADASGSGRTGQLIGEGTSRPAWITGGAPLTFANRGCLRLDGAFQHGIAASPIPPELRTKPELTLAVWFKTTSALATGSELVALGGDYLLRIKPTEIEWLKRHTNVAGMIFVSAQAPGTAHLDGRWHHLAGTSGAAGMKIYLDGQEIANTANSDPPYFTSNDQIGVGFQPGTSTHVVTGDVDEVRIYNRILTGAEVRNLAIGNR